MVKNFFKLFTPSEVVAWGRQHSANFLLAASLLVSYGMFQVPNDPPITYTVNGYTVVRHSELGPLTWTMDNAMVDTVPLTGETPGRSIGPGHDYGAIGDVSNLAVNVSPAGAIHYTVNGYTILRPSELGPLAGTVVNPHPAIGPGHDYGAIGY